ncbi:MAG: FAD-dependent oxidoreductase [Acidimicrobiia bacterium]|nr:FAD-dependent oxidoreductase [Acidimicrobiia bacterium]
MKANAVVGGAGIAGVSTAFHLCRGGVEDVVLVDLRPPLTLTSDKSTECYRNWWPNQPMAGLMDRSIDLLEAYAAESGDAFNLTRRGYLFVTADPERLTRMEADSARMGHLGVDFLPDRGSLRQKFPFLTEKAVGGLHALRAGWFSAQQFGAWMLTSSPGVKVVRARVTAVETDNQGVSAVVLDGETRIDTRVFVNAAGPMLSQVGALLDVELPVFSEVHLKVGFRDYVGVIARDAPVMIWSDPQYLDWSDEERSQLERDGRLDLLGEMPAGCHGRPQGGADSPWLVALWEYHRLVQEPVWPLPEDRLYPEAVMKGMATMIPGLARYQDRLPQPVVDGGYYTKTRENRPLIGPLPIEGAYVVGALSGFGVMAAAAAGELATRHIIGAELPEYSPAFALSRYDDPTYLAEIEDMTDTGQI